MIGKAMNSKIRAANERPSDTFSRHAERKEQGEGPRLSRFERDLQRRADAGGYKIQGLMPDYAYSGYHFRH